MVNDPALMKEFERHTALLSGFSGKAKFVLQTGML